MQQNKSKNRIDALIRRWMHLIDLALEQAPIEGALFRDTARDTFRVLTDRDGETIPRDVAGLLMLLAEFSAYAVCASDARGAQQWLYHEIADQLGWQFLQGFGNCGSAYPILNMPDNTFYPACFDLEKDDLDKIDFAEEESESDITISPSTAAQCSAGPSGVSVSIR